VVIEIDWEAGALSGTHRLKVPNGGAEKNSTITWQWTGGNGDGLFYILFPDGSPFMEREFASDEGRVSRSVVYDPHNGGARRFKYIIAAYQQGKGMHILDPEIIIPRPGGR
jgi:hypothetical protein